MTSSKAPHRNRSNPNDPAFEKTRKKIQATQIVNVLMKHIVKGSDMSSTQVAAGLGLLKKVLPDLQATTISGDADNPITIEAIKRIIVDPKNKP